ncbi:Cell division protein FtsI (Peptidoglycan synthetase) [Thioalkalivibrio nitratireducens DSM 14787]|uniref:Peptidoglycan D,D-transpeptidase FtsI n=1 Tax=Thioalkalivibrio nitratireducens (strain DSM 14787 / UNIQEM 213 / ALEN2) TaxID=1255043 RepID=L0E0S0_THIND|nr:penicillin-binding protein 2 [Thioalkalivibrio nitratireducens]AGA34251.1 Cell division protein FtsI (Peptidoglycan synthetase) [Thioalkalivibrio nitratireducens DSM 14787]
MGALKRQVSHLRLKVVAAGLLVVVAVLVLRALDLQVLNRDFLQGQGEARQVRTVVEPAHRGLITDRHGEPLAISGPVETAWAHPGELWADAERLPELARVLGLDPAALRNRVESRADREFIYLRRHLPPEQAHQVAALQLPGVALMREFRRYYPHGETVAHIVGFTNIDEEGQEGMELAFDGWLSGQPGAKRVLRDRHGRSIRDVASIRPARDGKDLRLTIDQRLQYLAYRELKAAVQAHNARGGSAVLVDARSGDILALVNQPGFNPNNRSQMDLSQTRNRAATDSFEPGSVIKPFTVAAALETGTVSPDVVLDTTPGTMRVGRHTVRDIRNFGRIDLATLISRSSNVGSTRLALETPPGDFWRMLHQAGFGQSLGTGLPGEVTGLLRDYPTWRRVEVATLGYGYGLSVTPMHLVAAYTAFANDGDRVPLRLVETAGDLRQPERVMRADTARAVLAMMERVTGSEGTARQAAIPGYRVAGKTGTSRKAVAGGYSADTYVSAFVGLAPVSDPRFVMAVVVDEPDAGVYYGGAVAAPVFARVVEAALRLFHVAPDNLSEPPLRMALERGGPRS